MSAALEIACAGISRISRFRPEAAVIEEEGFSAALLGDTAYVSLATLSACDALLQSGALMCARHVICETSLGLEGFSRSPLCELRFSGTSPPPQDKITLSEDADLAQIARIIAKAGGRADEIYTALFYRRRYGVSRIFGIFLPDNTLIGTVCHDFTHGGAALVGTLVLDSERRGQGLGFAAAALAAQLCERPYLLCAPALEGHYANSGFCRAGMLHLYEKSDMPQGS